MCKSKLLSKSVCEEILELLAHTNVVNAELFTYVLIAKVNALFVFYLIEGVKCENYPNIQVGVKCSGNVCN